MRVVLATANAHKIEEIRAILLGVPGIELLPRPVEVPDVDETGDTLEANAVLKARALVDATGSPALADDTGLEVDALGGAPGVRSARYAGPQCSSADNVRRLLAELAHVDAPGRTARFSTVAALVWPDGRQLVTRGHVDGRIVAAPRGSGGFGYDPVFAPAAGDGRTFAEMSASEKNAISHRAEAFGALARSLLTERGVG